MSKQKANVILIASTLKPWDDHRMYEKWALFFFKHYEIRAHLFGFPMDDFSTNQVFTHPSMKEKTTFERLKSMFRFLFLLFKLRPNVVLIETFELLLPSYVFAIFGFKKVSFFYDIQENYGLNLKSQQTKNAIFAKIGCAYINFVESMSIFFIDHFFITEAIYAKQLSFLVKGNYTLIENFFSYPEHINKQKEPNTFLVTGTLSKAYGIDLACDWILKIKQLQPLSKFLILGQQTDDFVFTDEVKKIAEIDVSKRPIAHHKVLEAIGKAENLILAYHWTSSFVGCTPVKLYEALHLGTKVLCTYEENLSTIIQHPNLKFYTKDFVEKTTLPFKSKHSLESYTFESQCHNILHQLFINYL